MAAVKKAEEEDKYKCQICFAREMCNFCTNCGHFYCDDALCINVQKCAFCRAEPFKLTKIKF